MGGWNQSAPQPCAVQQGSGAPRPAQLQPAGPAPPVVHQPASAPQPGHPAMPSARQPAGRAALPAWQQLPGPALSADCARAAAPPAAAVATAEARPQAAAPAQLRQAPLIPVTTGADRQPNSPSGTPGPWQPIAGCASRIARRLIAFEVVGMPAMPPCGRSPVTASPPHLNTRPLYGLLALCTLRMHTHRTLWFSSLSAPCPARTRRATERGAHGARPVAQPVGEGPAPHRAAAAAVAVVA